MSVVTGMIRIRIRRKNSRIRKAKNQRIRILIPARKTGSWLESRLYARKAGSRLYLNICLHYLMILVVPPEEPDEVFHALYAILAGIVLHLQTEGLI